MDKDLSKKKKRGKTKVSDKEEENMYKTKHKNLFGPVMSEFFRKLTGRKKKIEKECSVFEQKRQEQRFLVGEQEFLAFKQYQKNARRDTLDANINPRVGSGYAQKWNPQTVQTKRESLTLNQEDMQFLVHIGFDGAIKAKYPDINVSINVQRGKLFFEGPDTQLEEALITYTESMSKITRNTLNIEETTLWNIITNVQWHDYFAEELAKENVQAKVYVKSNHSVTIVASDAVECEKAQDLLCSSVIFRKVEFPKDVAVFVQTTAFQDFLSELERGNILKIRTEMSESVILLAGVDEECLSSTKKKIEDFLKTKQIQSVNEKLPKSVGRFLKRHFSSKVKPLEESLKEYNVSIRIDEASETVQMEGTNEGLAKCNELFSKLCTAIVEKDETVSFPGLTKLILGENGKRHLDEISVKGNVDITVKSCKRQIIKNPIPLPTHAERCYNQCNFTSKGVIVSWKYGCIEDEKADILVNSAHSDLNDPTACTKALNARGGASFVEACKPHTNISPGDIAFTTSGNLACTYVIHAVCSHWNEKEKKKSEKLLRGLVKKILDKCIELGVSSLAMPAIGTGQHRFSEKLVFKIFRKEIIKMSTSNPSPVCLKEIRVIIFKTSPSPSLSGSHSGAQSSSPFPSATSCSVAPHPSPPPSPPHPSPPPSPPPPSLPRRQSVPPPRSRFSYSQQHRSNPFSLNNLSSSPRDSPADSPPDYPANYPPDSAPDSAPPSPLSRFDSRTQSSRSSLPHARSQLCQSLRSDLSLFFLYSSPLSPPLLSKSQSDSSIPPPFPLKRRVINQATNSRASNLPALSFGSVRVFLHEGDITQHQADAIINVLPNNLRLSNGGGVCKSILTKGGQSIQQELDDLRANVSPGSVFLTNAGSLQNVKKIIHFVPTSTDVQGLEASIEKCFKLAKLQSLDHVSIPAIGTASFNISPEDSAALILKAAKNFSNANLPLDISFVGFQKTMVTVFETVVNEKAQDEAAEKSQSTNSQSSTTTQAQNTSGQLRLGTNDKAVIHFVGTCQQDINAAHEEVKMFIEKSMARKVIDNEKIYEVIKQHLTEVKKLSEKQDVLVTCSPSKEASIEGMVGDVSDCKDELTRLLANYEEKEREENQLDHISQYVQWSFYDGAQSVMYDKQSNGNIEIAFRDDKNKLFQFIRNGIQFEIDFAAKTEKNQPNGQVVNITRTVHGSSDVSLPAEWDPQPPGQVVHLVSLSQSSSEYQQVLNHFTSKRGTSQHIIKIERIQNPRLYKVYLVHKQSMNGEDNEMQLFHGTKADNTHLINVNNFSRSFAGINGVVYGNGVYFARDASYSLHYAQPGSSNHRQMYMARVLVGRYTAGKEGMKAPPSRNDPANPGLLYDSVVDDIDNPTIFVIFIDHQCYPEYLITFLQKLTK